MEFSTQQFTQHVRNYIEGGHTGQALEILGKCLRKDNPIFTDILILQNQFNEIKRREYLGLDADKTRIREIGYATAQYLELLEKKYPSIIDLIYLPPGDSDIIQNDENKSVDIGSKQKSQYTVIKGIILLLFLSIGYCLFSKVEEFNSMSHGIDLFNSGDFKKSFKVLSENVSVILQSKSAQGSLYLGYLYCTGYGGIKNDEEALFWWKKSADFGCLDAMLWAGNMYNSGGRGIISNKSKAKEFYDRAASKYEVFEDAKENEREIDTYLFLMGEDNFEKTLIAYYLETGDCKSARKWLKKSLDKKYINEEDDIIKEFVQKCVNNQNESDIIASNSKISQLALGVFIPLILIIVGIVIIVLMRRARKIS